MDGGLYYQARVRTSRRVDMQLTALTPPRPLEATFRAFQMNEHVIYVAQQQQLRPGVSPSPADRAFAAGLERRHSLGIKLDASYCDGQLPPRQVSTVVAISRRFDLTTNPQIGCRALVLPEYLATAFMDGYASCAQRLATLRAESWKLPRSIRVENVSGVEGIAATVQFYEEGSGCACDTHLVTVRLYHIDGSWRVRWAE